MYSSRNAISSRVILVVAILLSSVNPVSVLRYVPFANVCTKSSKACVKPPGLKVVALCLFPTFNNNVPKERTLHKPSGGKESPVRDPPTIQSRNAWGLLSFVATVVLDSTTVGTRSSEAVVDSSTVGARSFVVVSSAVGSRSFVSAVAVISSVVDSRSGTGVCLVVAFSDEDFSVVLAGKVQMPGTGVFFVVAFVVLKVVRAVVLEAEPLVVLVLIGEVLAQVVEEPFTVLTVIRAVLVWSE